nr:hypothetical protein [Eubacterium sp.]
MPSLEKNNITSQEIIIKEKEKQIREVFQDALSDRLFDENEMYTYIETFANMHEFRQTSKVLPYVRELHKGQVRKGKDRVPYVYHPLMVACHALALGLDDDDMISAALLHDVCEDCEVKAEELPVNEPTKRAVALLTKQKGVDVETYYQNISENAIATMVKLLDRCNNVSGMAAGFSKEKIIEYIKETEQVVYPLWERAKSAYPMYSNQLFLLKYHMSSVLEALKHQG